MTLYDCIMLTIQLNNTQKKKREREEKNEIQFPECIAYASLLAIWYTLEHWYYWYGSPYQCYDIIVSKCIRIKSSPNELAGKQTEMSNRLLSKILFIVRCPFFMPKKEKWKKSSETKSFAAWMKSKPLNCFKQWIFITDSMNEAIRSGMK